MEKQLYRPLVDAHAHIFTQNMPLIDNPRHRPAYSFTLTDYLAQLDTHGVQYGVIAAASPWGDYNDYTRDSIRGSERLRGTVILHPGKTYDLAAMKADGVVGVRLPFIGLQQLPDITTPEYQTLLKQIADLDWHVHLHVEGPHIPALLPILEQSGPKIVIDHLGRPDPGEGTDCPAFRAICASVNRGKSWLKASCAYRIGDNAGKHFQDYLNHVDPSRLFWASDCPFVGHEKEITYIQTINWLAELVGDDTLRRQLFGGNALKFYFS